MRTYSAIIKEQPELKEAFFAFTQEQFEKAIREKGLQGKNVYRDWSGLYGTMDGIHEAREFFLRRHEEIATTCTPQEVYDYEFNDYECQYTGDDTEAYRTAVFYFGHERVAKELKRLKNFTTVEP